MHERRLARPVVTDKPDTLAGAHGEIHAVKRTDGAEVLFDAVQPYDIR
jgi:hypothetical protein